MMIRFSFFHDEPIGKQNDRPSPLAFVEPMHTAVDAMLDAKAT
jgi:hypothetical protein